MPSADLILMTATAASFTTCVLVTYRAHHTAVSLLEQNKPAAVRQRFADPRHTGYVSARYPLPPEQQERARRRPGKTMIFLVTAAVAAAIVYLMQSSAHAATTTAARPVLAAAHTPPHPNGVIVFATGVAIGAVLLLLRRAVRGRKS